MVKRSIKLFDQAWDILSQHWVDKREILLDNNKITSAKLILLFAAQPGIPDYILSNLVGASSATLFYYDTDENNIITSMDTRTYITAEDLFMNFIDCGNDINKLMEYFTVVLSHEMGHIIYSMNHDIGRNFDEAHEEYINNNKNTYLIQNSLRKNASVNSRIEHIKHLHQDSRLEKAANDAAGLTIDDIIRVEKNLLL